LAFARPYNVAVLARLERNFSHSVLGRETNRECWEFTKANTHGRWNVPLSGDIETVTNTAQESVCWGLGGQPDQVKFNDMCAQSGAL
jgi:hypothetical protein